MPRRVELLYRLQRLDTQINALKRQYQTVQAKLGENRALLHARQTFKTLQDELSTWRAQMRDCELEIEAVKAKRQETEELLYSGRIKSPKELSDLQKESEYLERRRATLEDKLLEAMSRVEELTTRAAIANEELTVLEANWRAENVELAHTYDELRQELIQLLAKRKSAVARVPPDDLEEYESLSKVRGGVAVTVVHQQECQTCRVQVPAHLIDRAREGNELVYCNGCDRILYVPGD